MENLSQAFQIILIVLWVLASMQVILYLREKVHVFKLIQTRFWVKTAVEAAEMLYAGAEDESRKKAYAVGFLSGNGLALDFESVDALIDSAIWNLNRKSVNYDEGK